CISVHGSTDLYVPISFALGGVISHPGPMDWKGPKRIVVAALAKADEAIDEVAYRPAAVRAFRWMPRWWLCDLARTSRWLDDRWATAWWRDDWIEPGGACDACHRRAIVHVLDGPDGTEIGVCGWCHIEGPILSDEDLQRELAAAAADSLAWRWRWQATRR